MPAREFLVLSELERGSGVAGRPGGCGRRDVGDKDSGRWQLGLARPGELVSEFSFGRRGWVAEESVGRWQKRGARGWYIAVTEKAVVSSSG